MIHFLGLPARDMFLTVERIEYDKLLWLFSARDMFWTGEWIKYDTLYWISS